LSNLLNIGRTGLHASKKALEVTGHNISNANTDGYSRQKVNQTTNVPITKDGLITGTGTRVKSITRVHDKFVEKRLRDAQSDGSYYQNRANQLSQVEEVFNEIDNEGLNKILNNFFNSFRDLANQPENETVRSVVRDKAQLVVKDFKRISETLESMSRGIDNKIERDIEDINQELRTVAKLNRRIRELEAIHEETGDLRDQRDLAIKNLSTKLKIHTYQDERGNYVVTSPGLGTIVTAAQTQELKAYTFGKDDSSNNMDGSVEVFYKDRPGQKVTAKIQKGSLAAVIKVRNNDIKELREKVDEIAYNFMNFVNAVHRKGYVNRKVEMDPNGNPKQFDAKGPTTGINFFKVPNSMAGAASQIDLSDAVKSDLGNISTALSPNSPGDNRVAIAISKLQHERVMGEGTATMEEYFLKTVGKVGLESGKAKLDSEQSEGLIAQAETIRERISGVSIDEETANMVRYQHAYEASAKVMQTANEMFDTVISIKR
jgi:flagellar hook-associated protein 1 FlgK